MKHKVWINIIAVMALTIGSGGIAPGKQAAAHAAPAEKLLNPASQGNAASGAGASRSDTVRVPSSFSCATVSGIPQTECKVLVALYNNTDGANWSNNSGWLVTNTPCSWYRITCNGGTVFYIGLYNNNLKGSIPPELGGLSNLQGLQLSYNQLSGSIPAELGGLSNLQQLQLSSNQLGGSIPPELGGLSNLNGLDLSDNQLNGSIPTELGGLSNLIGLDLHSNQLSGSIPTELGGLSNLQYLRLSSNQLSGSIPPELGGLSNLQSLYLSYNQLSGSIPPELGGLSSLNWLFLSGNQLSGSIPPELGGLTNLQELHLDSNQLSGTIPPELGGLKNLLILDLFNNALSGDVPLEITTLGNLYPTNNDLGYNKLTASDPNVITFLNNEDPDWAETQTVPPTDLSVSAAHPDRIDISWTPIAYTADHGYYEVSYSDSVTGTYTVYGTTLAKTANGYSIDGLASGTTTYFRVRTFTAAHGSQQNDLWSDYTQPISGTTTIPILEIFLPLAVRK